MKPPETPGQKPPETSGREPVENARERSADNDRERAPEHLLVGQIGSAHGLRGEVSLQVLSENSDRFAPGRSLMVGPDPSRARAMQVDASRSHSGRILVRFLGVTDRTSAESLRGLLVFVEATEAGPLEPESFWEHELIGARVMNLQGSELGFLAGMQERFEQDIWTVETASGPVSVPAVKQIIISVDKDARTIVVDPPEGLFPPGAATSRQSEAGGGAPQPP